MRLTIALGALLLAGSAHAGTSDATFASHVEGAYFITDESGVRGTLVFDAAGTVTQVVSDQPELGFTAAQGAWVRDGDRGVRARLIDFDFELPSGRPKSSTVVVYEITFSSPESRRFLSLEGTIAGQSYAPPQDPLAPTEPPIGSFAASISGERITVD